MILRPYQERLVSRAVRALETEGNTLAVAATGAGKTVCLSALGQRIGGRQLVLQHRTELVSQNLAKYRRINPKAKTGLFTADCKSWRGQTTFAMVQTLVNSLDRMPKQDLVIIDEAHHVAAPTYRKILDAVREANPDCRIAGFTATPERTDRKGLRAVFNNVADVVTVGELVAMGFLVPPRAYVVDVGGTSEALAQVKGADFGDQAEVAAILNTAPINEEVVRNWKDRAGDRRTIIFCSTVEHAQDVAAAFCRAGVKADCVHGGTPAGQREAMLRRLARGDLQVLTNVMVLTEGFDCPLVSCVVLLRKCSAKSPLIQMVGRGLRTVDPEQFPGVRKKDCVVLDFGTSLLTHGDITADTGLGSDKERDPGEQNEAATKECPECGVELPQQARTCPLCGYVFGAGDGTAVTRVELTEMDIMNASPFRYTDLFGTGRIMIASGFEAWAGVFSVDGEDWDALGRVKGNGGVKRLARGERIQALASADDFLRTNETDSAAKKSKRWLDQPATDRQGELMERFGYPVERGLLGVSNYTKYEAACHCSFQFDRKMIELALGVM
jgi:superfamily II DNA or RNA helicase